MKRILLVAISMLAAAFGQAPQNLVIEAWEAVSQNYVQMAEHRAEWDQLKSKLARGPLAGSQDAHRTIRDMVGQLGNSRLQWLSAEDVQAIVPEFSGAPPKLGLAFLSFEFLPGKKKVISPLWRSPAMQAGLRTGDELESVNGTAVKEISPGELLRLLRQAEAAPATLLVVRAGKKMNLDVSPAEYRFVSWEESEGNFAITLREFTAQAGQEFDEALNTLRSKPHVKSVVLDVRNNPGGLLDVMYKISAAFISDKEFTCRKDASKKTACEKAKAGNPINLPVTVLVNEGTASAAEILAAGFQRTGRGKVVGCKTYGHGFGGQLKTLSDGSAMLIPDTSYLDAKGQPIEGRGIVPDVIDCRH